MTHASHTKGSAVVVDTASMTIPRTLLMLWTLIVCSLTGCAADPSYTWGEASLDLASATCARLAVCGAVEESDLSECTVAFMTCDEEQTCDVSLPADAGDAVATCVDALASADCAGLQRGSLPSACVAAAELRP